MKATQDPLLKQGWVRVVLYVIGASLIVYAFQQSGDAIINQFSAGTEKGDASFLNFGILYALMGASLLALTWTMRKFIDRKSFGSLGLTWKGYSNEAGLGFFGALAILGIGSLILVATGYISFISATLNLHPI
ncbi:MAG: hypothetical protein M3040_00635, partial [Bacteroidota bacterium]|nr:hypothetical protein [Bacteroidota bacterium]